MAKGKTSKSSSATSSKAKDPAAHAPVGFDSGASYDREKLQKGLDSAVDRQGSNRDTEVRKALDKARTDATATSTAPPNAMPDHKPMRAERVLSQGVEVGTGKDKRVVGEVKVTEIQQVYSPDRTKGDEDVARDTNAGQAVVGGRSEITSLEPVKGSKTAAPPPPVDIPPKTGETGEPGTTTDIDAAEKAAASGQTGDDQ